MNFYINSLNRTTDYLVHFCVPRFLIYLDAFIICGNTSGNSMYFRSGTVCNDGEHFVQFTSDSVLDKSKTDSATSSHRTPYFHAQQGSPLQILIKKDLAQFGAQMHAHSTPK